MSGFPPTTEPFNSFTRAINRCIPGHGIRAGPFPPRRSWWQAIGGALRYVLVLFGALAAWICGPFAALRRGPRFRVRMESGRATQCTPHILVFFFVAFRITYFLTSVIHLYWEPVHQFRCSRCFEVFFKFNLHHHRLLSRCRAVNAASPRVFFGSLRHELA